MYYDVVCSIYKDIGFRTHDAIRVASYLLCGDFDTKEQAEEYINTHDCGRYNHRYSIDKYSCIEIEEHNTDGTVLRIGKYDKASYY